MSTDSAGAASASAEAVFAALGDRTRLDLLAALSGDGARSITSLSADTRLTRQAVTKHLQVLESAGLVRRARVGRETRFGYRADAVIAAKSYLDRVSARWDEALSRLRDLVED